MRLAGITKDSISDGAGIRTVLFFQGCPHHCNGCQNPSTWRLGDGIEKSIEETYQLVLNNCNKYTKGITLSGGEPFIQDELLSFLLLTRRKKPEWNIWAYSGYLFEELLRDKRKELELIDVLVDGRFDIASKSLDLAFRGSANQRLIDIQSTLKTGVIKAYNVPRCCIEKGDMT